MFNKPSIFFSNASMINLENIKINTIYKIE